MAPELQAGFRILAHPADIGIAFQGPTMGAAFVQAAEGLRSLLAGEDRGELLYNWLSELTYRFDADQKVKDRLGLGLSIVKSIVDAHDGMVSVTSAAKAGTTFIVRLPRGQP